MSFQVSSEQVVAIIFFALSLTSAIAGNIIMTVLIGEINRTLQEDRESYFWYYPGRMFSLIQKYRNLYPSGKLHLLAILSCFGVGIGIAGVMFMLLM